MSYHRKYPLPGKGPDENLILTWDQGYNNIKAYYNKEMVAHIDNAVIIKKGYSDTVEGLGLLELSFNDKPMVIKVKVDGITSPLDLVGSKKSFAAVATYFYVLFGFSILGDILLATQVNLNNPIELGVVVLYILITITYLLAGIFSAKSQVWAYFMGTFVFGLITIVTVLIQGFTGGLLALFPLIIRGLILYGLLTYFKEAIELSRAPKTGEQTDILDI